MDHLSCTDSSTQMPVMDGLSATRLIRQKELRGEGLLGTALTSGSRAGKQLTIIAVTANVRDEQIKAAIEAGLVRDPCRFANAAY